MSIQPLGGIDVTADNVVITYWDGKDKKLWVLTHNTSGLGPSTVAFQSPLSISGGKVVYDSSVVPIQYSVVLATGSSSGTGSGTANASFTSAKTSVQLDLIILDLTNPTVSGTTGAQPIALTQQSFQPWTNPPSLLTGANYVTTDPTSSDGLFWEFLPAGTTQVIPGGISFLPISYYYGCTSSASKSSSTIPEVLTLAYCGYTNNLGKSACNAIPSQSGWVSQTDCVTGTPYTYCATGVSCSGGCVSQDCATAGQQCLLSTTGVAGDPATYTCRTPTPSGDDGGGGTSHKVWIIIAIVGAIIGLIVIIWLFMHLHSKKEKEIEDKKLLNPDLDDDASIPEDDNVP